VRAVIAFGLLILPGLLLPGMALAAGGVQEPLYGQFMFGSLHLNDNTVSIHTDNDVLEGELPDSIPYLGVAAQVILADGLFGYGWEGGGYFSWVNDSVSYYARSDGSGATVRISADNSFWSVETFMGLYGSFKPLSGLRFYVGAGPLFLFATTKVDNVDEPEPTPLPASSGSTVVINTNDYHSDFTVGYYGRAGFDIHLQDNWWLGGSVRYMHASVDLSKTIGEFDVDGNVYFFTLTRKL